MQEASLVEANVFITWESFTDVEIVTNNSDVKGIRTYFTSIGNPCFKSILRVFVVSKSVLENKYFICATYLYTLQNYLHREVMLFGVSVVFVITPKVLNTDLSELFNVGMSDQKKKWLNFIKDLDHVLNLKIPNRAFSIYFHGLQLSS